MRFYSHINGLKQITPMTRELRFEFSILTKPIHEEGHITG